VSFSTTNIINAYYLMLAWKAHEHIDFNFTECRRHKELRSEDKYCMAREPGYVRRSPAPFGPRLTA